MENFNNFKIIGVRPLKGCNPRILKNLKEDQPYFFYSYYTLVDDEIIDNKQTLPVDFFSPGINIHAIVGVNGSGKSSVIDILSRLINNLAYVFLYNEDRPAAEKLSLVKKINAEFYYSKNKQIYTIRAIDNIITWIRPEKDDLIFDLESLPKKNKILTIDEFNSKKELENLFYTIVTNYSLYAYNSFEFAHESLKGSCWLDGLFHKNDGYLTPIVFNPYRVNGNINLNRENELTLSRLITLFIVSIIRDEEFHEKYSLNSITLKLAIQRTNGKYRDIKELVNIKLKKSDIDFAVIEDIIINLWNEKFNFKETAKNTGSKSYLLAINYLVYKTIKITENYPNYKFGSIEKIGLLKQRKTIENLLRKLIDELNNDSSHITLKIRQTTTYLLNNQYSDDSETIFQEGIKNIVKQIVLGKVSLDGIMNLLPPPIFETSFFLSFKSNNRTAKVEISDISSGERQMLYSLSSILYHLSNIDSIIDEDRVKYNSINLVLEEVELYYHPEYQRTYVSELIRHIKMLNLKNSKNIDICIITHSPFILSDIPSENILFLDNGMPKNDLPKNNTFGSNIYDLLNDSFFLKENAIGVFANDKIKHIIDSIKNNEIIDTVKLKTDIEFIGEPIIRNYLLNKLQKYVEIKVGRQ